MNSKSKVAIIGSGASAIFVLKHVRANRERLGEEISAIHIFERDSQLGTGMPYNRKTTDHYNMCNISSAEIPSLDQSLVTWLASLDDTWLKSHRIERKEIDDGRMYSRLTLGEYFSAQYQSIVKSLAQTGIPVIEHSNCDVRDVIDSPGENRVYVVTAGGEKMDFDRLVIATGHAFQESDEPQSGYYASPWPMHKLIPESGTVHNFTIGTLGSSLSAFDVVASLSHRHGRFERVDGRLVYHRDQQASDFQIVMHSSNGWLPHLQYEQAEEFREIYRHASREQMLQLRDSQGGLSLADYFDEVCRPALCKAFAKDERPEVVDRLKESGYSIEDFVDQMTSEHEYEDPFAGMRAEMPEAKRSVYRGKPIHWKEVLDDLIFTLNFHFEWLYAEDVLTYREKIVPFLMNVIAAMPLQSAETLLALSSAGCLELVPGRVTVKQKTGGKTLIEIDDDGQISERTYSMFIDCTGQGKVSLDQFPFKSLVDFGTVLEATARFRDRGFTNELANKLKHNVVSNERFVSLKLGGILIDGYYRLVGKDGQANPRIFDIAFPHATGIRPYSYGLQACDTTAAIVVATLCDELIGNIAIPDDPKALTRAYDSLPEPA